MTTIKNRLQVTDLSTVLNKVKNYTPAPSSMSSTEWDTVSDYVTTVATELVKHAHRNPGVIANPVKMKDAEFLLRAMAYHCHRIVSVLDADLTDDVVYQPEVVAWSFASCGWSEGQAQRAVNWVERCGRVSKSISSSVDARTVRAVTFNPVTNVEPYTGHDLSAVLRWSRRQSTEHRCQQAFIMVSLALGGGLTASEIMQVTPEDVDTSSEEWVEVHLPYRNAVIPGYFARELADLVHRADRGKHLVLPVVEDRSGSSLGWWIKCNTTVEQGAPSVSITRLRATWLTGILQQGLSPALLAEFGGIHALEIARFAATHKAEKRVWKRTLSTALTTFISGESTEVTPVDSPVYPPLTLVRGV